MTVARTNSLTPSSSSHHIIPNISNISNSHEKELDSIQNFPIAQNNFDSNQVLEKEKMFYNSGSHQRYQHHPHNHHHSLDRETNKNTSNRSTFNPRHLQSSSKSSRSNTSISVLDANDCLHNSEEFLNASHQKSSGSVNGDSIETRSCGGGRSKVHKDPSKYHHHHHHHHHHHNSNCAQSHHSIRINR